MKLLVYFTSERLLRSFFDLGYMSEIKKLWPNVRFVCLIHDSTWQIPSTINHSKFDIEFFSENNLNKTVGKFVLDFFTYINRENSVSFQTKIRIEAKIPNGKNIALKTFFAQFNIRWLLISVLGFGFLTKINKIILSYVADKFFSSSIISKKFLPDSIILVSGGPFSNVENSTIYYAGKKNLKCALIIDNWDNLSSKSIIWRKPDLLGVWGPNMLMDAINIHGIDKKTISIIGSSRICEYPYDAPEKIVPYVLFASSGNHRELEIELIKIAHTVLRKSGLILLYRPHPVSKSVNPTDLLYLKQLELFESLEIAHEADFYSIESLSSLIFQCKSAAFVIASHSTVIVESLFLGKQVISYSGTKSPYFFNRNLWNGYKHLQELNTNTSLRICSNPDEFYDKINNLTIEFNNGMLEKPCLNSVPEILPDFQNSYKARLTEFVHKLEKLSK
jgi:hypothetical protein